MIPSLPIARIYGVEIRAHWTWVLALGLVTAYLGDQQLLVPVPEGWTPSLSWITAALIAALGFLSVAGHELAHVAVARHNGVGGNVLTIQLLGGAYVLESHPRTPGQEFRLAAAGPALSLGLALLFGLIGYALPAEPPGLFALAVAATWLFLFNVFLSVVNLLPSYPMDGGRIVRAILWRRLGDERPATAAAGRVGRMIGLVFIAGGVAVVLVSGDLAAGLTIGLAGWLLIAGAGAIGRRAFVEGLVTGLTAADAVDAQPAHVPPQLTLDNVADEYLSGSPGQAVVVERGGEVLGLLGIGQLKRVARRNWSKTRSEEAMTPLDRLPVVSGDTPLWPVLEQIERTNVDGLLVTMPDGSSAVLTRRMVAAAVHRQAMALAGHPAARARGGRWGGLAWTAAKPGTAVVPDAGDEPAAGAPPDEPDARHEAENGTPTETTGEPRGDAEHDEGAPNEEEPPR